MKKLYELYESDEIHEYDDEWVIVSAEKVVAHGKSLKAAYREALKTHKQHELIADYVHKKGTIMVPTPFVENKNEKGNNTNSRPKG